MNYSWDNTLHLFRREKAESLDYSDGVEVEDRLLRIVANATDRGTFSLELAEAITDWPSEYHLSRQRHCLVRPLGIRPGEKVLELGCGCGAITRFLGEVGAEVVAVEGGLKRACIAAERCRDLPNVRVVVDNLLRFESDELFDYVLLIGVLEYAAVFSDQANPFEHYLGSVLGRLAPGGRVVVGIENKLGLKYFNGCAEDHLGVPYVGVQDLYRTRSPRTFGRQELIEQLSAAGLSNTHFYYPFPDYKLPAAILSDAAFEDGDFDPVDLLARCHARDYSGSAFRSFDDALAFSTLNKNGLVPDLSNSFLVVAAKEPSAFDKTGVDLAVAYSVSRAPEFCIQTRITRKGSEIAVVKEPLLEGAVTQVIVADKMTIRSELAESPYHRGRQLLWDLLKARASTSDVQSVTEALGAWMNFLLQQSRIAVTPGATVWSGQFPLASYRLPGRFLDCTPFNLLHSSDGFVPIDVEWQIEGDISLGWVVTRGVLWSLAVGVPKANRVGSLLEVVQALSRAVGIKPPEAGEVTGWLGRESAFQAVVLGRPCDLSVQLTSSGLVTFVDEITRSKQRAATQEDQIASLRREVEERAAEVATLLLEATKASEEIDSLNRTVADRIHEIVGLNQALAQAEKQLADANRALAVVEQQAATSNRALAKAEANVEGLSVKAAQGEERSRELQDRVGDLEKKLRETNVQLSSLSWKLTKPLRRVGRIFPKSTATLSQFGKVLYWLLSFQLPGRLRQRKAARQLLDSCLFDPEFYLAEYHDVSDSGINPLVHYISIGAKEGRKPNRYFDTASYLNDNPDVAVSGTNPLLHYLLHGFKEGRRPGSEFNGDLYLSQNPDVLASGMNPLAHFLKYGRTEGRKLPTEVEVQESEAGIPVTKHETPPVLVPPDLSHRVKTILQARDGTGRMLIIDHAIPTPDMDSGSVRMFSLVRLLGNLGWAVTFASHNRENGAAYVNALQSLGVEILCGNVQIRAHLEQRGARYSAVIISRPEMVSHYLSLVRAYAAEAELYYDSVDLHHLRFRRAGELRQDAALLERAEKYLQLESLACAFSDRVLAITDTERDIILGTWPNARVEVLPNVHRLDLSSRPWSDRGGMVFIGGYDHEPNVDGVVWFVREILPRIGDRIPEAQFTVLGSRPPEAIKSLSERKRASPRLGSSSGPLL